LPVIFDVRLTKPVRRAVASISSEEKKSVHMDIALRVHVVMGVSLVWCEDATGNPSYHLGETSTFHGNAIAYRFMRMPYGVLSAVDNRQYKRMLYAVPDHAPRHDDIEALLERLQRALEERNGAIKGITTDGSALYPEPIRKVLGRFPVSCVPFMSSKS
jgi:hypothetical protein